LGAGRLVEHRERVPLNTIKVGRGRNDDAPHVNAAVREDLVAELFPGVFPEAPKTLLGKGVQSAIQRLEPIHGLLRAAGRNESDVRIRRIAFESLYPTTAPHVKRAIEHGRRKKRPLRLQSAFDLL
jgi:hypothetical protein